MYRHPQRGAPGCVQTTAWGIQEPLGIEALRSLHNFHPKNLSLPFFHAKRTNLRSCRHLVGLSSRPGPGLALSRYAAGRAGGRRPSPRPGRQAAGPAAPRLSHRPGGAGSPGHPPIVPCRTVPPGYGGAFLQPRPEPCPEAPAPSRGEGRGLTPQGPSPR